MFDPVAAAEADDFQALLDDAKKGSYWAWEALHSRLSAPITGYFAAMGIDDPGGQAVLVLRRVAGEIRSFRGDEGAFRTWVFGIARETLHRLNPESHSRVIDLSQLEATKNVLSPFTVHDALAPLDLSRREAIALMVGAGLDCAEAGHVLRRRPDTVSLWRVEGLETAASRLSSRLESDGVIAVSDEAMLSSLVESIAALAISGPANPTVESLSVEAKSIDIASRSELNKETEDGRRQRLNRIMARPALSLALLVALLGAPSLAAVADSSVPGDVLYGLDRALEEVGFGASGHQERLEEAGALIARGDTDRAIALLGESYEESIDQGDASGASEISAALGELVAGGSENAEAKVDAILEFLENNRGTGVGLDGKEFGQGVADIAREGSNAGGNNQGKPPEEPGNGNQQGPGSGQGNSGGTSGPPQGKGKPN